MASYLLPMAPPSPLWFMVRIASLVIALHLIACGSLFAQVGPDAQTGGQQPGVTQLPGGPNAPPEQPTDGVVPEVGQQVDGPTGFSEFMVGTWFVDLNDAVDQALDQGWNAGFLGQGFRFLGGSSTATITINADGTGSGSGSVLGTYYSDSGSWELIEEDGDTARVQANTNTGTRYTVVVDRIDANTMVLHVGGFVVTLVRQ